MRCGGLVAELAQERLDQCGVVGSRRNAEEFSDADRDCHVGAARCYAGDGGVDERIRFVLDTGELRELAALRLRGVAEDAVFACGGGSVGIARADDDDRAIAAGTAALEAADELRRAAGGALSGVVGERQVQPGDYVNIGSSLINVVPLPNVYVIANYKETQLTRVQPGQPVDVTVDSFPSERLHGRVERIAPASGSQFALLPPDNATGNFTKVVQRIPVRIALDKNQPLLERLLPGMSVVTKIHTGEAGTDGGK